MSKPELLIGSDRIELYDYFGKRKETFVTKNKYWLKFCFGLTVGHFLLVRVPALF